MLVGDQSELEDGFGFQLPHPFTGDIDLAADFSQRLGLSTFKAKAQFEDLLLPLVELGDPGAEMFL